MSSDPSLSGATVQPPKGHSFSRPASHGPLGDPPDLSEDPRNLYTLPYMVLLEAIADCLFPPNRVVAKDGREYELHASAARVDRFVLFRAAWEPSFGIRLQLALRDFTDACINEHGNHGHFVLLSTERQTALLTELERGEIPPEHWSASRGQRQTHSVLYDAVSSGLFAEPGYGGNHNGLGWYYSNFMVIGK